MLVTLSDVKSYLGITGTTYDAFLTEQITLVSDTIEAYCRRKFLSASYTQTFYSDENSPSKTLSLFMYPVISVASVVADDVAVTGYRTNKGTGILTRPDSYFFLGKETVVTYTAGFTTLPTPIRQVIYSLMEERYNKKVSGVAINFGSDVQRVSIPGTISIDFDYTLQNNERTSAFGTILGSYVNSLSYYRSHRAVLGDDKLIYLG